MKNLLVLLSLFVIGCNSGNPPNPPVVVHQSGGEVQIGSVTGTLTISRGIRAKDTLSGALLLTTSKAQKPVGGSK